jgi:hypothetical protein
MSQRIRQLEDGLGILQSSVSQERHPLLSDELLTIKFGAESINRGGNGSGSGNDGGENEHDPATNVFDALGTLTLSADGEMKYFGRSAGTEVCFLSNIYLIRFANSPSRHCYSYVLS